MMLVVVAQGVAYTTHSFKSKIMSECAQAKTANGFGW